MSVLKVDIIGFTCQSGAIGEELKSNHLVSSLAHTRLFDTLIGQVPYNARPLEVVIVGQRQNQMIPT